MPHSFIGLPTRVPLRHGTIGLFLASALSLLFGCSEPSPDPLIGERIVGSLLQDELRSVVQQNEDRPVKVRLIKPRKTELGQHELLPALEMAPPARVTIAVPKVAPGTTLELATGFDSREWKGRGKVRFRASLNDQLLFEETRTIGEAVPNEDQAWNLRRIDVSGGGTLTLETHSEGNAKRQIAAAFGSLDLLSPYELEREVASTQRPNVIMIVVDTLRADRLHCYGHEPQVSPAIDALAESGTMFERAFSAAPWTPPSTASLLTGLAPPAHGIAGTSTQYLPEELTTIAEAFRDAGIETAAFSANPLIVTNRNFAQGFRTYREFHWIDTSEILGEISDWIRAQGDARYFLYLHLVDPHDPYRPPEDMSARFAGNPPVGWEEREQTAIIKDAKRLGPDGLASLQPHNQQNLALYDAEIASIDARLGELFAMLEDSGQSERSVIALTSDHGEEFMEHGLINHALQLHDESVHVPLILSGPGVPAGQRVERRVPNRFLGASLLRLAGIRQHNFAATPDLFDSKIQHPVITTTTRGILYDEEQAAWIKIRDLHSIRDGNWRLDWAPKPTGFDGDLVRLYDLASDPDARNDMAVDHPDRVERLKRVISVWLKQEGEQQPRMLQDGQAELELLRATGYAGNDDE
ncbi:MAG: arylsulfatase [Planctomycetota bacterium]|jgi:arylsulfatase